MKATLLIRRPQLLTDFLNANPTSRTLTATTLVLSLWQMGGQTITPRIPSLLLIDAGETETDPLDAFINQCQVLARLAAEGLIELDGKKVVAVPLAEFVEALHARPEFL